MFGPDFHRRAVAVIAACVAAAALIAAAHPAATVNNGRRATIWEAFTALSYAIWRPAPSFKGGRAPQDRHSSSAPD
jgi:hypothetical protein